MMRCCKSHYRGIELGNINHTNSIDVTVLAKFEWVGFGSLLQKLFPVRVGLVIAHAHQQRRPYVSGGSLCICETVEKWLWLLFVIGLLAGCGSSPSDAELGRALVRNDPLIGKVYQISNIHRSNGYEQSEGYIMEFVAEIHVLENPAEYLGRLAKADQGGAGAFAALGLAAGGLSRWGLVTTSALSAAKKGDVIPFSGSVTMIRSEQGWILRPG